MLFKLRCNFGCSALGAANILTLPLAPHDNCGLPHAH